MNVFNFFFFFCLIDRQKMDLNASSAAAGAIQLPVIHGRRINDYGDSIIKEENLNHYPTYVEAYDEEAAPEDGVNGK